MAPATVYDERMDCPLGHGELRGEDHTGFAALVCAVCTGEWFDRGGLDALEKTAVSDDFVRRGMVEYQPHESAWNCPACVSKMYEFDYRGNPLMIDACPQGHGYWLDGGEEAQVRELIRQRARDLQRSASAELSFGQFLNGLRGKLGGPRRSR